MVNKVYRLLPSETLKEVGLSFIFYVDIKTAAKAVDAAQERVLCVSSIHLKDSTKYFIQLWVRSSREKKNFYEEFETKEANLPKDFLDEAP